MIQVLNDFEDVDQKLNAFMQLVDQPTINRWIKSSRFVSKMYPLRLAITLNGRSDIIYGKEMTLLELASMAGLIVQVDCLLKKYPRLNKQNALRYATQNGHLDVVSLLLDAMKPENLTAQWGYLFLRLAAQHGHLLVFNRLLEIPNIQSGLGEYGYQIMRVAVKNRQLSLLKRQLEFDELRAMIGRDTYQIFQDALASRDFYIIRYLLKIEKVFTFAVDNYQAFDVDISYLLGQRSSVGGHLSVMFFKDYPKVKSTYTYPGEHDKNPVYHVLNQPESKIPLYEKRIWVLRTDGALAIGIKNDYVKKGNTNLFDKIEPSMLKNIRREDRYGHPSLAMPEGHYDGSVYYAGWICQHPDHLAVYLWSGRYRNRELTTVQRFNLEKYISEKFVNAYGNQPIIFTDWNKTDQESNAFLQGYPLHTTKISRVYGL